MQIDVWTIIGLGMIAVTVIFLGWVAVRSVKRSDDPARLAVKWILTVLVVGALALLLGGWGPNYASAFVVPVVCVFLGVALSLIWAPSLGAIVSRPLTSLFDGGMQEAKPEPLYSMAQAQRKRGRYHQALWEIQRQLEQFPTDFTGQMLMAEIQATDLKDLEAARATVTRLCEQAGHAPAVLADALSQLAEWHLKYAQDTEAARQALEQIVAMFPDSAWAHAASQRLAHLGGADSMAAHDRQPLALPHLEESPRPQAIPAASGPAATPAQEAQNLVRHLEEYPDDNEAREQLATLYTRHYQRLDLASAELEQLIAQPHAPVRQKVHWLNLLADWQLELGRDEEAARLSLNRIVDLCPGLAAADLARQRMEHLGRELKKADEPKQVRLGSYDQDIGLRKSPPWLSRRDGCD